MPSKILKVVPVRLHQDLISLLKTEAVRRNCGISLLVRELIMEKYLFHPKDQTPGDVGAFPGV